MIYRKDRNSSGGGVFIAIKDIYPSYPLENYDTECEIVWASLQLSCQRKVQLASFYRPPTSNLETTVQFCRSVNKVFNESAPVYPQVIIGGDFNLPGIELETMSVVAHSDVLISQTLIDCVQQNNLSQLVKRPTRGQNVLDLATAHVKSKHLVK